MGEIFSNPQGRTDARLRVIFDNGTESNMLMRSFSERCIKMKLAGGSPIRAPGRYSPVNAQMTTWGQWHDLCAAK